MQNLEIVLIQIHEKTNGGKEFWNNRGLLFFRDNGSTNYKKAVSITRCNNDAETVMIGKHVSGEIKRTFAIRFAPCS